MAFRINEIPDRIILYVNDSNILDESRVREFDGGLADLCRRAASSGKKLIVDFRGAQFMSSAMIGTLVAFSKLAKQNNVDLCLANVCPNIMEVFKITRLSRVFRINRDDDGPDLLGAPVPLPKPPSADDGRAEPPQD
jgi:anti-anti-sigma factor